MAAKLLMYFSAAGHSVYRWRRGRLQFEARFSADDAGVTRFREYFNGRAGALVQVVADLGGEDFHEDQIPDLRGAERQAVIERRLAQRYRDTRLATALPLGYTSGERRNERLLLASFNDSQQFAAWLDVLEGARARVAGIYSTPLIAPALAARLGVRGGPCFVMSANRAGLRQCFVENGRLRFARLERTRQAGARMSAAFVRAETERMLQYLATLRALPRDAPAMRVILIVADEERAQFEQALGGDARIAFATIGMAEAARRAGLHHAPEDGGAELFYLQLAGLQPPNEQFLRREDRRSFLVWRAQRAIVAASVAAAVACGAYAATLWLERLTVRETIAGLRLDTAQARDQLGRIAARFPATPTTIENLKSTALEFRRIAARSASPEAALAHLSRALDRSPRIELEALTWSTGRGSAPGDAKPETAPAPVPFEAAGAEPQQTLEISARLNAAERPNYRAVTEEVQRFAALLGADPAWRVVGMRLPFDLSSDAVLSGGAGAVADSSDVPRFTIWIARSHG